ncbi:S49 family peptidase [Pararoseomonas indoligenes]|uniref:S49 family peptidase n=1 Tax=Roseomonas indoligenes TaxID=2820811 RepID=A0A940S6L6_9PROT|nr:S49 family peptidase [Pararoseomonas indoligenes]MBP0492177.1 S49 family peptidase [Pararoseomonas indoligenes]
MSDLFPRLAQRIFNTPLALHPQKAEVALTALAERLGIARVARADGASLAFDEDEDLGFDDEARPCRAGYDLVGGVALIQVEGMLVQKTGTLRPYSGMTGYDGLRANFLTAMEDPLAEAIVLDLNSGGGEVAGCFDLADLIYASRGLKPIWAICSECAYSAAYALASACDRVTVPRTGGTGSVGVVTMLVDYSKAIERSGLAVHFVHYGSRKMEETRAMHGGVKPDLLERIQRDVDVMGELFVATVARNRNMSVEAVRAQQADYYLGAAGVQAGLADAVMAPDEALMALMADLDAAAPQ